jgi:hypothetical protein
MDNHYIRSSFSCDGRNPDCIYLPDPLDFYQWLTRQQGTPILPHKYLDVTSDLRLLLLILVTTHGSVIVAVNLSSPQKAGRAMSSPCR